MNENSYLCTYRQKTHSLRRRSCLLTVMWTSNETSAWAEEKVELNLFPSSDIRQGIIFYFLFCCSIQTTHTKPSYYMSVPKIFSFFSFPPLPICSVTTFSTFDFYKQHRSALHDYVYEKVACLKKSAPTLWLRVEIRKQSGLNPDTPTAVPTVAEKDTLLNQ